MVICTYTLNPKLRLRGLWLLVQGSRRVRDNSEQCGSVEGLFNGLKPKPSESWDQLGIHLLTGRLQGDSRFSVVMGLDLGV